MSCAATMLSRFGQEKHTPTPLSFPFLPFALFAIPTCPPRHRERQRGPTRRQSETQPTTGRSFAGPPSPLNRVFHLSHGAPREGRKLDSSLLARSLTHSLTPSLLACMHTCMHVARRCTRTNDREISRRFKGLGQRQQSLTRRMSVFFVVSAMTLIPGGVGIGSYTGYY
ncbi:hypothetical protein F4780DRAFT_756947 [Xylariomycetidae sp. FL0641]|nr:hypothetical protein F4780DRAFT_756947 [Xylariomycetidae sp. FL0641]